MFHYDNKRDTEIDSFQTSILKNLLQNSDLLETLLKPMSSSTSQSTTSNTTGDLNDVKDDFLDLNCLTEQILDKSAKSPGTDGFWSGESTSKVYGNAFLGPNLWDKSDLYDGNKFSNVRLESLDIDDFLTENGLNVSDAELLEQLTKSDLTGTTVEMSSSLSFSSNDSSKNGQNLRNLPTSVGPSINEFSPSTLDMELQSEKSYDDDDSSDDGNSIPDISNLELSANLFNNIIDKFDPTKIKFTDQELKPQPIIKKSKKRFVPTEAKDDKYWSRRKKNNVAAKRSRDARRTKENQIVLRAAFLERENETLKKQLENSKNETKSLQAKLTDYETNYIMVPRK